MRVLGQKQIEEACLGLREAIEVSNFFFVLEIQKKNPSLTDF